MSTRARTWLVLAASLALPGGAARAEYAPAAPPLADPGRAPVVGVERWVGPEAGPGPAAAFARGRPEASFMAAPPSAEPNEPLALLFFGRHRPRTPRAGAAPQALGGERARILLRSLTVPGWGQATLGHGTSAAGFGVTEAAIWGTFAAFRIQVAMREDTYLRTARILAGIDLGGRDEEWRRIVGGFASSEEYNRLVVARDAANLFLGGLDTLNLAVEPDLIAYRARLAEYRGYIAANSLKGSDAWRWASPEDQARYRDERKNTQRAARRANTMLAIAVLNRIASALHAARASGHPSSDARPWQFEVVPVAGDATAFQFRVHARF